MLNLPQNITLLQSIRGLKGLEVAIVQAFVSMTNRLSINTNLPELEEPFQKADSCEELGALGTD